LGHSCWQAERVVAHYSCTAVSPADGRLSRLLGVGLTALGGAGVKTCVLGRVVPGWLGWTPASRCSAVRRSAYLSCSCRCNTSQQDVRPWARSEMDVHCMQTGRWTMGMAMAICLYCMSIWPASTIQTTAADAPPALPGTPGTHDLFVVRLGELTQLCCWPGGREAPFGGTWLCGFPH
jgi:hypothetical protein